MPGASSVFALTSPFLLGVVIVVAIAVPVVLVLLWRRRLGVRRAVLGFVSIVVCQAVGVLAVGLVANNHYGFYNTWDDLFGEANSGETVLDTANLVPSNGSEGSIVTITAKIPGTKGLGASRLGVMVWLPKQYKTDKTKKFPVLMVLPGQPSGPQQVFELTRFGQAATQAIDTGKVPPFVAVFPPLMIAPPRDTECTDIPKGPQALSWLADSVPQQITRSLRVLPPGPAWSVMGFSTGGFCSAKLLLRYRGSFGAAASIGGYYATTTDDTTGDLFKGDTQLERENSPLWLIQRAPQQENTNLLIVVSTQDTASYTPSAKYPYANSAQMIKASSAVKGVSTLVLTSGGHSYRAYAPTVPNVIEWFGKIGAFSR